MAWFSDNTGDPDDVLQQGDLLFDVPIPVIHKAQIATAGQSDAQSVKVPVVKYDVIILTQSCVLAKNEGFPVLVTPLFNIDEVTEEGKTQAQKNNRLSDISRNHIHGYRLLGPCECNNYKREYSIIHFREIVSVEYSIIISLAMNQIPRIRLIGPYREYIAQECARFFMRVALPEPIHY
jgi:hypothetical protein